ncbi:MAG: response regulator transcription factor [Bacteroidota bacterium]
MEKLLVIEDELILRENLKELLTIHGYEVATARDGEEGLHAIKEIHPDLVICDIRMPKLNGYELFEEVKNMPESFMPFLFLSAKVEHDDVRKGMNLGADDYLTKPVNKTDLLAAVQTRLRLRNKKLSEVTDRANKNVTEKLDLTTEEASNILGKLSKSEKRILYYVAQEKSTQEIANLINLSPKTVENHRHHISKKLDLKGGHSVLTLALKIKPHLNLK